MLRELRNGEGDPSYNIPELPYQLPSRCFRTFNGTKRTYSHPENSRQLSDCQAQSMTMAYGENSDPFEILAKYKDKEILTGSSAGDEERNLHIYHNNIAPAPLARNVHFSPVVSQLRYRQVDHHPLPKCIRDWDSDTNSPFHFDLNGSKGEEEPSTSVQKVTVHVQQVDKPVYQKVQRVQVSVPHENGRSERMALDFVESNANFNDNYYKNRNSEPPTPLFFTQNNQLIGNSYADTQQVEGIRRGEAYLGQSESRESTHQNIDMPCNNHFNHVTKTGISANGRLFSAFGISDCESDVSSLCKCGKMEACECIMKAPAKSEVETPLKMNALGSDHVKRQVDPSCESCDDKNDWKNNGKGALEDALNSSKVLSPANVNTATSPSSDDNQQSDKISKGHSWPNAYRKKLREKSKPKLSFLQRITFGLLGGGAEEKSKKKQKRSSCPPLGHPLLTIPKAEERISTISEGGGESCVDCGFNNLSVPLENLTDSLNYLGGGNDRVEKNLNEGEISAKLRYPDLPPKPSPRQKKISTSGRNAESIKAILESDDDEFSLKFERILEGILEGCFDFDDSVPIMEEKLFGFGEDLSSKATETDIDHFEDMVPKEKIHPIELESPRTSYNHNGCNGNNLNIIPEEDKPSNLVSSVVGKPPRPPISRQIGMRTGASERFSYLRGRLTATAATETRLAMELAAKLCEFREELHRSREEIAKSHPNLDEIENSVRISLAIDRNERSLPRTRNCTTDPSPPLPTTTTLTTNSSSTAREKATLPLKPIAQLIKEEWDSVVGRARENFARSSYNHQQRGEVQVPSFNNGVSGEPYSPATILETDLDTGTSRGFPADTYFSYGDSIRRRDLGKVLTVEDFTTTSPPFVAKNSCSLQNLSGCGVPSEMATLKPGDPGGGGAAGSKEDRSRSMEFLLDDSNKNAHLRPPENTLMKNQETRRMSEHELRIQRSLQKLNVPDWYKNYAPSGTSSAAATPSKSREFGSGAGLAGGWPGLSNSKTSSLTSLQSAGRYAGSKSGFAYGRHRTATGTASTPGRSSRESLMSPSSTASASPSPNFERSSFTYGMPYALTRFAAARMSCGASPASLSPSPSPVGGINSSTSTPVSSGPTARYGYQKTPYLGWRSQERLNQKSLYRSPAERLAADLIAQKKPPPTQIVIEQPPPPEIEIKSPPKTEIASSDLSLNNSEESNSHKLNRVRSSIKEVSNAIVDYVNETKPLDDGMNGASPRRGFVWLESSFVGTKPIDSPGTPDTPSTFMSHRGSRKENTFRFDDVPTKDDAKSGESSSTSHYTSYISRNEQMEERSNSSSVSSPTLEDILDSLLALRRPNKKFRSRGKGETSKVGGEDETGESTTPTTTRTPTTTTTYSSEEPKAPTYQSSTTPSYHQYQYEPSTTSEIYSTVSATRSSSASKYSYQSDPQQSSAASSDWQDRMNQPLADSTFISGEPETFTLTGSRAGGVSPSSAIISGSSYNSSNSNINATSIEKQSKFSGSTPTSGVADIGTGYSSYVSHSASSSMHSTPTHQPHQKSSGVVASSKDYFSSASSSPAKSCLVESHRDENELRQSLRSGGDDEDELAFGNPTEIRSTVTSSTVGGVIINPLTGLSEYSNPPTPARHRRVSFDLDFSDKEEKSSSRSKNKDENVGGTIQCRKCGKTASGLEARREFKVCHNCNAYYCSRECRRAHWEKHKKTCMQSRVGAICKQIISHVKEDSYVMNQLSTIAKRGFLAKGRGCVKLFFNSPDRAERFLTGGLPELPEPLYIPHSDMLPEEMGAQTFSELSDQCKSYNPETRFVLYACVCVVNEVPTYGAVKWERELISRSSKLRLLLPRNFYDENQRHHHLPANPAHLMSTLQDSNGRSSPVPPPPPPQQPHDPLYDRVAPNPSEDLPPPPPPHQNMGSGAATTTPSENDTLILRSVPPPASHQLSHSEHKRLREVSFTNIQKHLLLRGVDLKKSYPDIYTKLCRYVEHDEPFLPVTIYPRNSETGRQFVCVIMPECSDSAYDAATNESGQRYPLQKVETINISEQDDDEFLDIT